MPELPEVECVRLSLRRRVLGRRVSAVRVIRPGVVRGSVSPAALLEGDRIDQVLRHGKQLALVGQQGGCVCIHLGMSGQLCVLSQTDDPASPSPFQRTNAAISSTVPDNLPAHTHVLWRMGDNLALRFTDPRRFGGLWTFAGLEDLHRSRWAELGPDALSVTPAALHRHLAATGRGLKAALLDQRLVAGLGNIYVDELLFGAGLHPLQGADTIDRAQAGALVRRMRTLLSGAIARGGSTLRDYVDAESRRGTQQDRHRVYGRAGKRCLRRGCGAVIQSGQIAGRTTAWCPVCQVLL